MKLAKLFAENGAAAIHMEDQLHGGKKVRRSSFVVLALQELTDDCSADISPAKYLSRLVSTSIV